MAITINVNHFAEGQNLYPGHAGEDDNDLASALRAAVDDLVALRAAVVGITAQLDADAGVTDVDYAANNDPAALTLLKG